MKKLCFFLWFFLSVFAYLFWFWRFVCCFTFLRLSKWWVSGGGVWRLLYGLKLTISPARPPNDKPDDDDLDFCIHHVDLPVCPSTMEAITFEMKVMILGRWSGGRKIVWNACTRFPEIGTILTGGGKGSTT